MSLDPFIGAFGVGITLSKITLQPGYHLDCRDGFFRIGCLKKFFSAIHDFSNRIADKAEVVDLFQVICPIACRIVSVAIYRPRSHSVFPFVRVVGPIMSRQMARRFDEFEYQALTRIVNPGLKKGLQFFQRLGPVTQTILHVFTEFGERLRESVRHKERIIAETALPGR